MKHTPFSIMLAGLLAASCGTGTTDHDHAAQEAHLEDSTMQVHHHGSTGAVQLDNGKPWEANIETTDGIQAMQAILDNFDPANEDGSLLKEELEAEFKDIFAKCTMTGEAHEQLHNYLIPVHGMLDKLDSVPTDAQREELSTYLGTYGNYFQ